jgi:PTH1 family peptidyl-tRNA hydrolase
VRVVAGLGNPGQRYRETRHNAGFMAIDVLASRAGVVGRVEDDAWLAEAVLEGMPLLLVKPLCFMNLSGLPLARLLAGAPPAELLVVVDDVALELGRIRVRERGSHGGHNGLRSIGEALGSEEFPRVRIGVRSGELPADLADYVLSVPPDEERRPLLQAVTLAADAVVCAAKEGLARAMDRFNGRRP